MSMSDVPDVGDEAFEDPYEVEMTDEDWAVATDAHGEWDRMLNDFPEDTAEEVADGSGT